MHTPSVKKGFLFSASPLAWGRGVAALCLQSAVRSRARWRWAGPEHRCGGGGGDWAAASACPKTGWKKRGQMKSKWFLLYQRLPTLLHVQGSQEINPELLASSIIITHLATPRSRTRLPNFPQIIGQMALTNTHPLYTPDMKLSVIR
ncbi:hypothetical protein EYF80_003940 [Liparis tanakae]|uniref:Uncharacterized protein n=1 Tax=Liparis tanakae TaxID=230148 RepID=A0A4Z2J7U4_9TELE|nr:hypothetical protein EYF80_003940 [Liparis tanakae]